MGRKVGTSAKRGTTKMPVRMDNSCMYTGYKITKNGRGSGDGDRLCTAWILACMPAGSLPIVPLAVEDDRGPKAGPCDLAA